MTPFDIIKNISEETSPLNFNIVDSYYDVRLSSRFFSFFEDTVDFAQFANSIDDKYRHYIFLFNVISKRKRYTGKWGKKEMIDNDDIMEYYGVGVTEAKEINNFLTEEEKMSISSILNRGGINK